MNEQHETINLHIRDYLSYDCSCGVEDTIKAMDHVTDVSYDPVNFSLTVKAHKGMIKADDIKMALQKRGITCEMMKPTHEMAHMEHEALQTKKPAPHDHHAMMEADMKRRFIVTMILTAPVLILSPTIQLWFGFQIPRFTGDQYLLFLLSSAIVFFGGLVFYRGALKSLKTRFFDMNVLVSIAVLSGYLFSVGSTFLFEAVDFYWEISTLVVFLLFGHWMEMKAVRGASGALKELVKLIPPTANLLKDGDIVEVPTSELRVDDVVIVRPGGKIPIDGVVIEGESSVNEAMVTGESKPVSKKVGNEVIGGTINGAGAMRVTVTKTGENTALAQIVKLVRDAMGSKPKTQKLADRAAHYLTLTAILVGAGTFAFWWGIAGADILFALTLAITVIVIACPHALGLAIPTVTAISTTMAAQKGMLVKNSEALEIGKTVNTVVYDKTGTLTQGAFNVTDVVTLEGTDEKELLYLAASVERHSEHPIGIALVNAAKEKGIRLGEPARFEAIAGHGVRGTLGDKLVTMGTLRLMKRENLTLHPSVEGNADMLHEKGRTLSYVAVDNEVKGIIGFADTLKQSSTQAIKDLHGMAMEVVMLTGDNRRTAEAIAKEAGVDRYLAEVLPEDKSNEIKKLQEEGRRVAMVGDGINDAPALVQADVGVAIGAGTDVAIESADIVLIKSDPRDVSKIVSLSKKTMAKMKQNLLWATGYNAAAIPIAAGILFPFNIILRPEWAAIIMATSSIIVVINALLLKRAKI